MLRPPATLQPAFIFVALGAALMGAAETGCAKKSSVPDQVEAPAQVPSVTADPEHDGSLVVSSEHFVGVGQ